MARCGFCELRRRRKLRFITGQMAINGYSTTPGSLCYYHFHQTPPRSSYIPHQISLRDLSPPVSPELSQTSFFLVLPLTKVHLPLTRFPFLTLARVPQRALNERLPRFCKIKTILQLGWRFTSTEISGSVLAAWLLCDHTRLEPGVCA